MFSSRSFEKGENSHQAIYALMQAISADKVGQYH
jgi:hypothetical protein